MSSAPTQPALEMTGVNVGSLTDPDHVSVEDVSWTVAAGDYWAIGGLQGSGKSDLLFTAAGLLPPLSGFYRVFGQEIVGGFETEMLPARLSVGVVFDGGRLFNHLTLLENVALPLQYHHGATAEDSAQRAASLLEIVGLADYTSRMPGTVNRNLGQRAGLARALALKPRVLLLDMPLSGLDPRNALWWLNFMDELAAGHAITDKQPLTLVATGDDLRPWQTRARHFAALGNRRFIPLGGRDQLSAHAEPLLQELLRH